MTGGKVACETYICKHSLGNFLLYLDRSNALGRLLKGFWTTFHLSLHAGSVGDAPFICVLPIPNSANGAHLSSVSSLNRWLCPRFETSDMRERHGHTDQSPCAGLGNPVLSKLAPWWSWMSSIGEWSGRAKQVIFIQFATASSHAMGRESAEKHFLGKLTTLREYKVIDGTFPYLGSSLRKMKEFGYFDLPSQRSVRAW